MSDEKYKAFRVSGDKISQQEIAERAGISGEHWKILAYGYINGYTYIRAERK